jgi:hypothetical protein
MMKLSPVGIEMAVPVAHPSPRTGRFSGAFVLAGAVLSLGAFAWTAIIRKVEPVHWR